MMRRTRSRRGGVRRTPGVEGLEPRRLMAITTVQYPIAVQGQAITAGLDNNLWFVGGGEIGAVSPVSGFVGEIKLPASVGALNGIVYGKDGNLYVTDNVSGAGGIGVFDPKTGTYVEYPTPTKGSDPDGITTTADGTIWFTEAAAGKIGSFNPTTHAIAEFPLGAAGAGPVGLAVGPDGKLWFTATGGVGQFDPASHAVSVFAASFVGAGIVAGPNGQLWFGSGNDIAEIDPTSHAIQMFSTGPFGGPLALASFGGKVYYSITPDIATQAIGSIDPTTHAISLSVTPGPAFTVLFRVPSPAYALGLAAGPDGRLWFADHQYIGAGTVIPPSQAAIAGTVSDLFSSGLGPGLTVFLDLKGDGILAPGDPTAVTNYDGYYTFAGLAPGTYTVAVAPTGALQGEPTSPVMVTAAAGQLGAAPGIQIVPNSTILPFTYSFNPFGTGNPDLATAEVNGLYRIFLGRAPDPTGLANSVAYLKAGGSLKTLASILLHTGEYESDYVKSYYQNFFGRAAAPAEVAAWVAVIRDGNLTAEQVASLFLSSDAFSALHPDNASFIGAVYQDVLGRPAAAFEVAAWESVLGSGTSRSAMVNAMIHSPFAARQAITGFVSLLWRESITAVPAADIQFDINYLVHGGNQADLAAAFASLPGFIVQAQGNVG